jgi:protein-S-isoprenylcysteine O-methyltransferase Ste14
MSNSNRVVTLRVVVQMAVFIIGVPFLPLLISRRWDWWEAWVFAAVCILGFAVSRLLAARRHPDLLAERASFMQHEDAKSWDKILAPLVGLGGALIPLTAGIEAALGRLTVFSLPVKLISLAVIVGGYVLGSYALIENRFFSGEVRIQTDRSQKVVTGGPYRWVRHPGYAGALWTYLAMPLFLDSVWTFLPAVFLAVVVVIRTRLEDQALRDELEGYREYAARVRFRLIPGVW